MNAPSNATLNIREGNQTFEMHYPNATDHQFKQVKKFGKFYDFRTLRYIAAVAKMKRFKVAYDVGTCFANHALYFGAVLDCQVECFEPNARLLPYITQNMSRRGVSYNLHNVALGDQQGFGATSEVGDNLGSSKFVPEKDASKSGQTTLTTLDNFITSQKLRDPDFIKIDTEGFECRILRGAGKLLRRAAPELFVEISPENEDEGKALLDEFGYSRVLFNKGKNYHYSRSLGMADRLSLTASSLWIDAGASLLKNAAELSGR